MAELRNVGPDLQAVRLVADVRWLDSKDGTPLGSPLEKPLGPSGSGGFSLLVMRGAVRGTCDRDARRAGLLASCSTCSSGRTPPCGADRDGRPVGRVHDPGLYR
jgi:hypothetical protein